jgi:hypothetical protein
MAFTSSEGLMKNLSKAMANISKAMGGGRGSPTDSPTFKISIENMRGYVN